MKKAEFIEKYGTDLPELMVRQLIMQIRKNPDFDGDKIPGECLTMRVYNMLSDLRLMLNEES